MKRYIAFLGIFIVFLFWTATGFALTVNVNNDTDINLNKPNQNNGVKKSLVLSSTREAFVSFDFFALPPDLKINQATLKLWLGKITNPGLIDLHIVQETWNELTITAAASPMMESSPFETVTILVRDKKKIRHRRRNDRGTGLARWSHR